MSLNTTAGRMALAIISATLAAAEAARRTGGAAKP